MSEQVAALLEGAGIALRYWYLPTEVGIGGAEGLQLLADAHCIVLILILRLPLIALILRRLRRQNTLHTHWTALALGLHHLR